MKKLYRIKHKPTGLYFCPTKEVYDDNGNQYKSNLDEIGKTYTRKLIPVSIFPGYFVHKGERLNREDFEIEEVLK